MSKTEKPIHVAMYPWFAMGHLTPFLHLSNKLAGRGHRISFFLPTRSLPKLQPFNLHPSLITFFPISVPSVPGLPPAAETTADAPSTLIPLIMTAMDRTRPAIEASLRDLRPQFVFFDFTHWLPQIARDLGIVSVHYCVVSPATVGYLLSPDRKKESAASTMAAEELMDPPCGFPPPLIRLSPHEARSLSSAHSREFGAPGLTFKDRQVRSLAECEAIAFKTCTEMEGPYCDYVESRFEKPVLLAGPVVPDPPPKSRLDEPLSSFLNQFDPGTVVFCALGSECVLEPERFQELVLGLELTGLPFLAAVRTAAAAPSSNFLKGFEERNKSRRGMVYGGWVPQAQILGHPAVGCFVTHCGSGSLWEAMVSRCQMVLLPNHGDQIVNAKVMGVGGRMKVGVEVGRGKEDGGFRRESVAEAVRCVTEEGSAVGEEARRNHDKWREFLLRDGVESSYIAGFVERLRGLVIRNTFTE